jgi:holo-[acyl-carrier protein] synthase
MIVGVGVDVVEVARVARALERHPRFGVRVFTQAEREASARRGVGAVAYLAKRWAAKEAVSKALGVGFSGFSYTEIEVVNLRSGAPTVAVHGEVGEWADQLGVVRWHLSLSDTDELAFATAIAEGPEVLPPRPAEPPSWVRRRLERPGRGVRGALGRLAQPSGSSPVDRGVRGGQERGPSGALGGLAQPSGSPPVDRGVRGGQERGPSGALGGLAQPSGSPPVDRGVRGGAAERAAYSAGASDQPRDQGTGP